MPTDSPYVLIVGGAGYIGSHMILALQDAGFIPVVLDNLSTGHRDAVASACFIKGDCRDADILEKIFTQYSIKAVMHFASLIEVGESHQFPLRYYENNVGSTLTLLESMIKHDIAYFIFSSSAAVYGEPSTISITENHPLQPISPYGRTKVMAETIIRDVCESVGMHYGIFRYFNAAGADPYGRSGERHLHETHLIPRMLMAINDQLSFPIYGKTYPTDDGTCVRDYVHVTDICRGHLLGLKYLMQRKKNIICNFGAGRGHSILEVASLIEKITGLRASLKYEPPRAGDPARLIADVNHAFEELSWEPQYQLDHIIRHAWHFFQQCVFSMDV